MGRGCERGRGGGPVGPGCLAIHTGAGGDPFYPDEPALGLRLLEVTGKGPRMWRPGSACWSRAVPARTCSTEIARLSDPPSFVHLMHLAAALGDPDELDPAIFLVVGNGFVHFDRRAREAAILATWSSTLASVSPSP